MARGSITPHRRNGEIIPGKWRLQTDLPSKDGRRRKATKVITASGKRDAERQFNAWVTALQQRHPDISTEALTFAQLTAHWIETKRDSWAIHHDVRNARFMETHVLPIIGGIKVEVLSIADLEPSTGR